jgi:hypothetical protein
MQRTAQMWFVATTVIRNCAFARGALGPVFSLLKDATVSGRLPYLCLREQHDLAGFTAFEQVHAFGEIMHR